MKYNDIGINGTLEWERIRMISFTLRGIANEI